jgi:hypothetical protein
LCISAAVAVAAAVAGDDGDGDGEPWELRRGKDDLLSLAIWPAMAIHDAAELCRHRFSLQGTMMMMMMMMSLKKQSTLFFFLLFFLFCCFCLLCSVLFLVFLWYNKGLNPRPRRKLGRNFNELGI